MVGRSIEIGFLIVVVILNLSAWSYLTGTISGLFIAADESIAASHQLMTTVVRFIQHNRMSQEAGDEIKTFFNLTGTQKTDLTLNEQNEIYGNLPLSLQVQVARHISRGSLTSVDLFKKTSQYFLDSISTLLESEVMSPGEYFYKVDDVCR